MLKNTSAQKKHKSKHARKKPKACTMQLWGRIKHRNFKKNKHISIQANEDMMSPQYLLTQKPYTFAFTHCNKYFESFEQT